MLTKEQLKALILCRVGVMLGSSNAHHRNHVEGQIRALLAVIMEKPAPVLSGGTREIFEMAEIPFTAVGDRLVISDDWLKEHGFEDTAESENIYHPEFSKSW